MDDAIRVASLHHTFEVVVEQSLGNPTQVSKGVQVTADKPGGIG